MLLLGHCFSVSFCYVCNLQFYNYVMMVWVSSRIGGVVVVELSALSGNVDQCA